MFFTVKGTAVERLQRLTSLLLVKRLLFVLCHIGRFPCAFETGTNVTEISRASFQKIRKLLSYRKANHSTEILNIPGEKSNGSKIRGRKFPKILVDLSRLYSFSEILENAVSFFTGNFWKFKLEFFVEWKAPIA